LLALLDQALDRLIERFSAVLSYEISTDMKYHQPMRTYLESLHEDAAMGSVHLFEQHSLDPEHHIRHNPRRNRLKSCGGI
jgi:hypothetical protein